MFLIYGIDDSLGVRPHSKGAGLERFPKTMSDYALKCLTPVMERGLRSGDGTPRPEKVSDITFENFYRP